MNLILKFKWCIFLLPILSWSQNPLIQIEIGYGISNPISKLNQRFGSILHPHFGVSYQPKNARWLIKGEGQYFFGNKVKTDVLANLRTPEGYIIGNDMSIADIQLRARGYYAGFSIEKSTLSSGFFFGAGPGFLLHRIRIQKDPSSNVPQLEGDYSKGYDRLTSGLSINCFLGYRYLSSDRRINFSVSLYNITGFTKLQRAIQFDLPGKTLENSLDLISGIKFSWILPFYFDDPDLIFY